MTHLRGVILVLAGALALFEAWKIHSGSHAVMALGLGLVAIGIGIWRLLRKEPARRQAQ